MLGVIFSFLSKNQMRMNPRWKINAKLIEISLPFYYLVDNAFKSRLFFFSLTLTLFFSDFVSIVFWTLFHGPNFNSRWYCLIYADVHPILKLTKCSSWVQNWSNQCDSISYCNSYTHSTHKHMSVNVHAWNRIKFMRCMKMDVENTHKRDEKKQQETLW